MANVSVTADPAEREAWKRAGFSDTLINDDLAPAKERRWGIWSIACMWMSDVHSVGGYVFAAGLFFLGLTGWQVLIAAVPTVPIAFALGSGEWFVPSWTSILVIAYIGMVPMAFGNAAWFAIVGLLPANVSGLSSVMVPMVAMVTGAIVHREPLGAYQLAAMACCAAAMALALFKPAAAAKTS